MLILWLSAVAGWAVSTNLQPVPPAAGPGAASASARTEPPAENEGDKFLLEMLAAGLGGFLAWMLTTAAAFYLTRRRLLSYLLVTVNSHLRQYHDLQHWLQAVMEKTIKPGHVVMRAARYTKDELGDLTEMRSQCLTYLQEEELVQFTRLCQRMFELEALFDGFCRTLDDYQGKATVLSADDVDYFNRKYQRLGSYLKILPLAVDDLDHLPRDYSGIEGAEKIVTDTSSAVPITGKPKP